MVHLRNKAKPGVKLGMLRHTYRCNSTRHLPGLSLYKNRVYSHFTAVYIISDIVRYI